MNITLRQMKVFESVVRLGSLTLAADEQAISQSAASQSLKELERQLGYGLFQKSGRSMSLTESGWLALPKIRQALASIEALQFPAEGFIGGVLRVSASETIASYLMPQLLAKFVELYPKVEPELSIQNSEGVVHQIESGQASVGFIEGPAHSSRIAIQSWREDELTVFAEPAHHWANATKIPHSEWPLLPWIVREVGSGTRAVFDSAFERRAQTPRIKLSLPRQEAIKQSARAGLGVGVLSELSVADEIEAGHLVKIESPLALKRMFSIAQLKNTETTPVVERFIEFVQNWSSQRS